MLPEHKNPIFVSKRPKISKKSPILTQNPDFVLERPENGGPEAKKRTKKPSLCSAGITEQHAAAQRDSQTSTEQLGVARNQYREARRGREQPPETGQDRLERSATATQRTQHTQRNTT